MRQIITLDGYLAIERIGGIDVYMDDCFVCELSGKTFEDFSYDLKKLDDAISDEIGTQKVIDKLDEINQYC